MVPLVAFELLCLIFKNEIEKLIGLNKNPKFINRRMRDENPERRDFWHAQLRYELKFTVGISGGLLTGFLEEEPKKKKESFSHVLETKSSSFKKVYN